MASAIGSLRTRAASILHSSHSSNRNPGARKEKADSIDESPRTGTPVNEKDFLGQSDLEKTQTASSGSRNHQSPVSAFARDQEAQRVVRTIPAWVHTLDEDDEDLFPISQPPLSPATVHIAQHNTTPWARPILDYKAWAKSRTDHPLPGRAHDHQRELTPPLPRGTVVETGSRSAAFASATAYPRVATEGGKIVTEEWLIQNGPDYSRPWLADVDDGDPEKGSAGIFGSQIKRKVWYMRLQRTLLRSPVVPMVIRMIVWGFSLVALCLACSLHHIADVADKSSISAASTDMAIVVDAVALVYLLYIAYDEYSGKPLGLRSARAKMRLIFLDLFFIVFDSANLSLAFGVIDGEHCYSAACYRQRALASVLLIALIAWLLTFSISVLRLVERVTGR